MTVTGKQVAKPGNYSVRFGTPIDEVIALAGGVPANTGKVIGGGPMMGRAMDHTEGMPANKRLSGLLFLPEAESVRPEEENCIRCSKCVQACPMGLEPYLLQRLNELEMYEEMEKHAVMDCIDCGCCVFACPAHRRLLDGIRPGKAKVGAMLRERAAAAAAEKK
jgi:electron transport complex protein RnfC